MSMNLHVNAELNAQTKIGKKIITEKFDLWQTPTDITQQALKSNDVLSFYKNWVLSITEETEIDVYADDDFFYQRPPIGKETIHEGKDHLKELDQWIEDHKEWDNIYWFEM